MNAKVTKKQKQVMDFIQGFFFENGYAPSYREIRDGLGLSSVSTVANHINNLIAIGLLRKDENKARSLEIVGMDRKDLASTQGKLADQKGHKWLISQVEELFDDLDIHINQDKLDRVQVVVASLRILGLEEAFLAYQQRLNGYLEE